MQDPTNGVDLDSPTLAGAAEGDAGVGAAVEISSGESSSSDAATIADPSPLPGGRPAKIQAEILSSTTVFAPGTLLSARYQILRILGQGGMGAVYQARDNELDGMIALKVMRPELDSNSTIPTRLQQETILSRHVTRQNLV